MYNFLALFNKTDTTKTSANTDPSYYKNSFLSEFQGQVFDNGLYRILDKDASLAALNRLQGLHVVSIKNANPVIFGLDWLGRYYAYDRTDTSYTTLFDVVEAETYTIEGDINFLHNTVLSENNKDFLEFDLFNEWHSQSRKSVGNNQCVSFKLPFFFGGQYEVSNLELSDIDVVWNLNIGLSGGV